MYRIFRHYIPKSLLMLGITEVLILVVSVYLGVALRFFDLELFGVQVYRYIDGDLLPRALVFSFIMLAVMMSMGLYQRDLREGPKLILMRLGLSFTFGLLLMTLVFYAFPELFLGRGVFGIAFVCAFIGIVTCRLLFFQRTDDVFRERVLVLGVGRKAQLIDNLRRKNDHRGVALLGYVDMGADQRVIEDDIKILQINEPLNEYVGNHNVGEIVVAVDDRRRQIPINELLACKMAGVRVIDVTAFYERQVGKIKLDSVHPSNFVFADGFSQTVINASSKRLFDILASIAMLVLFAPSIVLVSAAIFLETGLPIIYRQRRVGKSGKSFEILKFRSMRVDAEQNGGVQWAMRQDERVTRTGVFIRKYRLDELPQLINVLLGDMSFVGPRPERPEFVEELSKSIPYYALRHYVKPGITGWAQISYPYGASESDAREKLQYELYYLKNYSLFLDINILFQTIQVVLWGKGAR